MIPHSFFNIPQIFPAFVREQLQYTFIERPRQWAKGRVCTIFAALRHKKTTPKGGQKWSGRRGSNSLPPPWQGGALPDELRPLKMVPPIGIEPMTRGFSVPCSTDWATEASNGYNYTRWRWVCQGESGKIIGIISFWMRAKWIQALSKTILYSILSKPAKPHMASTPVKTN